MSDDDDDRYTPPASREPEAGAVRPMALFIALGWTFLATFAFVMICVFVGGFREASKEDPVSNTICQVIGYAATLALVGRLHAPSLDARTFLGLKKTSFLLYPLGLLIGLSLFAPASELYDRILARWPDDHPSTIEQVYDQSNAGKRAAIIFVVSVIGPAVEEFFFRGAIYGLLRRMARKVSLFGSTMGLLGVSVSGKSDAVQLMVASKKDGPSDGRGVASILEPAIASAAFFAIVHVEPQSMIPIFLMGLVFAAMRQVSGSVFPTWLAHGAFNGFASLAIAAPERVKAIPDWVTGVSAAAAVVFIALFVFIARGSAAAEKARAEVDA